MQEKLEQIFSWTWILILLYFKGVKSKCFIMIDLKLLWSLKFCYLSLQSSFSYNWLHDLSPLKCHNFKFRKISWFEFKTNASLTSEWEPPLTNTVNKSIFSFLKRILKKILHGIVSPNFKLNNQHISIPRAAGTYEDIRTGPHHVFRIQLTLSQPGGQIMPTTVTSDAG